MINHESFQSGVITKITEIFREAFLIEFQRTISLVQVFLQRIEEKCSNDLWTGRLCLKDVSFSTRFSKFNPK